MVNCKNCGAPLTSHICEYCGTNYSIQYGDPGLDALNNTILYANIVNENKQVKEHSRVFDGLKAGVIDTKNLIAGVIKF